jgi:hypothetical protein
MICRCGFPNLTRNAMTSSVERVCLDTVQNSWVSSPKTCLSGWIRGHASGKAKEFLRVQEDLEHQSTALKYTAGVNQEQLGSSKVRI